jgi:hypothetical protein
VNVKYTYDPCFGPTFDTIGTITIPYGSSTGTLSYDSSKTVDCGQSNCEPEFQTIDCVDSISGQTGLTLYPSSPISAC